MLEGEVLARFEELKRQAEEGSVKRVSLGPDLNVDAELEEILSKQPTKHTPLAELGVEPIDPIRRLIMMDYQLRYMERKQHFYEKHKRNFSDASQKDIKKALAQNSFVGGSLLTIAYFAISQGVASFISLITISRNTTIYRDFVLNWRSEGIDVLNQPLENYLAPFRDFPVEEGDLILHRGRGMASYGIGRVIQTEAKLNDEPHLRVLTKDQKWYIPEKSKVAVLRPRQKVVYEDNDDVIFDLDPVAVQADGLFGFQKGMAGDRIHVSGEVHLVGDELEVNNSYGSVELSVEPKLLRPEVLGFTDRVTGQASYKSI